MDNQAQTLEVQKITKTYDSEQGSVTVLKDLSFTAKKGETIAILGPSGSGKSTLLNIIGSLDEPTSGSISLEGSNIIELKGEKLANFRSQKVGFVFQDHHLLPQLTALENILLPSLGGTKISTEQAEKLLDSMELKSRSHFFPWQLSGGEKQRIAIARAMVNSAKLLLCDEPTGNLDRENGENIIALLQQMAKEGAIVIMVTHDLQLADKFDRQLSLQDGSFA